MSGNWAELEERARNEPEVVERALAELKGKLFVPHPGQIPVRSSDARFRVLGAGRRFGKTKLAANEIVKWSRKPDQMIWWVANTYKNVRRGYREVVRQMPASWLAKPAPVATSNELMLTLKNGTIIEFYSGGNPDALAGEGVDFMVVDEAALIPNEVWSQLLRPTLMDTQGHALIFSTPRGHNWFWEAYNRGQDGAQKAWSSWTFPQTVNPYIPNEETEEARLELPRILFAQEIMAEFLASGASIFGEGINTDGVVVDMLAEPYGDIYVGIDLGKENDFTVISASRGFDRMPVFREKFNAISWPAQREKIRDAIDDLNAVPGVTSVTAGLDSTGLGDVIFDDLTEEGVDVVPINFNNTWKEQAVKRLAADMEKVEAHILEEQLTEFESYEYSVSDAGNYKFEAASGHDDEVSAKLMEHWVSVFEGPPSITTITAGEGDEEIDQETETLVVADRPVDIMNRDEVWH